MGPVQVRVRTSARGHGRSNNPLPSKSKCGASRSIQRGMCQFFSTGRINVHEPAGSAPRRLEYHRDSKAELQLSDKRVTVRQETAEEEHQDERRALVASPERQPKRRRRSAPIRSARAIG